MPSEYSIDNLILYSRCPMLVFFREYMGMEESNSTVSGQVKAALRIGCSSYLNNVETDPHGRAASRAFNGAIGAIQPPASARGGGKAGESFQSSLRSSRAIFERFRDMMGSMEPVVLGAPYEYSMTIERMEYHGAIDALILIRDIPHVVTLDFSSREPSEDILGHGFRATVASYAYREIFQEAHHIIHYWIPKDYYLQVDRVDGQYSTVRRELRILAELYDECKDRGLWYRSRGFWCDSCYLRGPCKEVRF